MLKPSNAMPNSYKYPMTINYIGAILNIYNNKLKGKCIKNLKTSSGIDIMGILKYKLTSAIDSND